MFVCLCVHMSQVHLSSPSKEFVEMRYDVFSWSERVLPAGQGGIVVDRPGHIRQLNQGLIMSEGEGRGREGGGERRGVMMKTIIR